MDVIKEEVITAAEAKNILSKSNRDKYEQKICIEYFNKIPILTKAKADKLYEELNNLNILNKKQIIEIINVLPDTEEEFVALFSKEKLKKEEIKNIVEIVKKYKKD
jgi:DNA-directed RNA polymerase subunit F